MPPFPERLADPHERFVAGFSAPLLDPDRATPTSVAARGGGPADRRYAVYRNNVTTSLADALAGIFPAVRRLVGEEFFSGMAIAFARAHPPRSRLLFEYGEDFPAYIASFEPARDLPYLADVARIERAWLDAYHAADAEPLAAQALAMIPPDDLAASVFRPHPALRILRSRFAAFSIFAANREEGSPPAPIRGDVPEETILTRPGLSVTTRVLPPGAATFLLTLVAGEPLETAIGAGFIDTAEFDPAAAIALMLETGAFTAIDGHGTPPQQVTGIAT
ncbi:DUF2063 domain-containing protein [Aquibium carbonis]|uniref:DUF2063 domain-containing protein n=1 Tax=Aquibium carbonis TaxID=2495581 RepID=A0A3S0AQR8_9HYPH|nr:DNA-binding domain-containing protein [Aquibium carbonis]RST84835.1 DUF2063 domain-containing protein [Aquibium carbonis]